MTSADEPLIVRPGEGPSHKTPFGDRLWWKTGGQAAGGYSLHERVAPPGSASTPHIHKWVSEAFYVMEGELEFKHGDGWITGGPGTFVLAPKGVEHAWRNVSSIDARVLVLFSPGVPVTYFEELERLAKEERLDPAAFRAVAEKYGLD